MNHLFNGIQIGLMLTLIIGPIFFTLIQTGIEQGFRAGVIVGIGIWMSDAMFILMSYLGLAHLNQFLEDPGIILWMGIIGGCVLMVFGVVTFKTIPKSITVSSKRKSLTILGFWMKGFLINTLNPFTFLFWITVTSAGVIQKNLFANEAFVFFCGIIGTIMITDSLKVLLAKRIRHWLNARHIALLRKISGIALFVFGVIILVRVFIELS